MSVAFKLQNLCTVGVHCCVLFAAARKTLLSDNPGCHLQVLLQPSREMLAQRLEVRAAAGTHFMPASLLDSQLALMEVDPAAYRYGMPASCTINSQQVRCMLQLVCCNNNPQSLHWV